MKPNTISVFMASDDNYAAITDVAIISMLETTKSKIDLFLINDGISDANCEKIKRTVAKYKNARLQILSVDIEKTFAGFKLWQHVSITTFARLLIPWIKPTVKRAIWVDVDVLFLDDIALLYTQDLGKFALGAAKCIEIERAPDIKQDIFKLIDFGARHTYFNAGVLLIDCDAWRADKNLPNGFFEIERKYPDHLCADQDILNKYFENNYKLLEQRFNITLPDATVFETADEYNYTMLHPVIRHFCGQRKAHNWPHNPNALNMIGLYEWWQYAAKSEFFGEFVIKLIQIQDIETKRDTNELQKHIDEIENNLRKAKRRKIWISLFGIIPLLKIKSHTIYLFGFIPFFRIKRK